MDRENRWEVFLCMILLLGMFALLGIAFEFNHLQRARFEHEQEHIAGRDRLENAAVGMVIQIEALMKKWNKKTGGEENVSMGETTTSPKH